jgi:phage I-like protein
MAKPPLTAGKAVHTIVLPEEPPEWVQLLPASVFVGRDGRGPYQVPNPEEVIRVTRERVGADLPIDYGHALELVGHEGDAARAAGWITDFEVRDGEIWGRVSWTRSGDQAIRGREFRFLSPVFYHDSDGTVIWILRAGLTNRPNLALKSINSNQAGDGTGEENPVADKTTLAPVAQALGLTETADEAAILARCSQATQAQTGLTRVAQALQLAPTATVEEIIQAAHSRATPDPTKYVPREQFDQVTQALHAAQTKDGERVVDALIEDGKLIPAKRAWALSYHARDPQGFAQFAEGLPVVVQPGEERRDGKGGGTGRELDADAKAVCARLGISEEDFIKNQGS